VSVKYKLHPKLSDTHNSETVGTRMTESSKLPLGPDWPDTHHYLRESRDLLISRITYLEIFFLINYVNLKKINLEIFGGHLAKFFCEVNLERFLEIFIS